jgi:hypothetical protein
MHCSAFAHDAPMLGFAHKPIILESVAPLLVFLIFTEHR